MLSGISNFWSVFDSSIIMVVVGIRQFWHDWPVAVNRQLTSAVMSTFFLIVEGGTRENMLDNCRVLRLFKYSTFTINKLILFCKSLICG